MKKHKGLIIICIFLVFIMIGQVIYFGIIRKTETKNEDIVEEKEDEGIVANLADLYRYYPDIPISTQKLENSIYKLVIEDFSKIHEATKNNNAYKNKQYYEQNIAEINKMGIITKDDFVLIAEELKQAMGEKATLVTSINLEVNESLVDMGETYLFDIIIGYSNNSKSNIRCSVQILPKGEEIEEEAKITYSSNSQISNLLKKYKVEAGAENIITTIDRFIANIKPLHSINKVKSTNQKLQYYDQNKDTLAKIGIYSSKDMQDILSIYAYNISWYDNQELNYYNIDIENATEIENYIRFKIEFVYDFNEKAEIYLDIRTKQNVEPAVRFTGAEG